MKVVLVNPPLTRDEQCASLREVANVLPPLGMGYIAAVLEKNNFEVKIVDCRPFNISVQKLVTILKKENPDIIGFTATVLSIKHATEAAKAIRKELPDCKIILGGAHITSLPQETMQNGGFDIGVIGEGEYTFLDLAKNNFKNLDRIKGIIYMKGDKWKMTEPRPFIQNLDELPFPARHLYPPLSKYTPVPASYKKLPLGHIITSRGCPFQCIFCDRKVFGNRFRAHSPKRVVDEIEHVLKVHGAREIKFFDDTFTMDPKRVVEICDEIKRRKLDFSWSCLTRVDRVSKSILQKMKSAGCWQVAYGLESGDQRILNIMKKGITLEQSRNAVKWGKEAGLNIRVFFVIGMPGETLQSIRRTVAFAKSLDVDVVTFYTVTVYPGNELYQIAKKEGTVLHEDYEEYNPLIDGESRIAYVPKGMTAEQLKQAIIRAHKEFYLRPEYILKQFVSIRSPEDIHRYWRGFKAIVGMK